MSNPPPKVSGCEAGLTPFEHFYAGIDLLLSQAMSRNPKMDAAQTLTHLTPDETPGHATSATFEISV